MASARDRRPHLHSPQCNRTPSPSLLCPSSRRGWIKRVMITQSRSHGAGPSRVSAARVLLIWRRGRHLEPLSLFIFPGATSATGDARVQRLHTRAPLLSSCRSCETDAAIDPFSPLQGRAGRPEGKAGGCRPVAHSLANRADRSSGLHGVERGQAERHSPVTPTRKCGMGVRGRFWSGRTRLSGFHSLFLCPFTLLVPCASFFSSAAPPTARANLGATQADHITIDLTCSAVHAARPRLSGPHPRNP